MRCVLIAVIAAVFGQIILYDSVAGNLRGACVYSALVIEEAEVCGQPTMLADVPQARTYINTYDAKPATFDALVDDLMAGPDAFKGRDPIDSFCGLFDARL